MEITAIRALVSRGGYFFVSEMLSNLLMNQH